MSRLTEKFSHNGFEYMATGFGSNNPYAIDKLGKLEDLEEQLGCPLEVVVEALEYGIYTQNLPREDLTKYFDLKLSNRWNEWYLGNDIMAVNTKYYKTLFWLKKDKSE